MFCAKCFERLGTMRLARVMFAEGDCAVVVAPVAGMYETGNQLSPSPSASSSAAAGGGAPLGLPPPPPPPQIPAQAGVAMGGNDIFMPLFALYA